MKSHYIYTRRILGGALLLLTAVPAWPCALGRIELAAPMPDLFFRPGSPTTWSGPLIYKNTGLGVVNYCTVYARSVTPGVSVVETNGSGVVRPPYVWADVGNAPPPGGLLYKPLQLRYDGTGGTGYIGRVEFSVRDDSEIGPFIYLHVGAMNVYLDNNPQPTWIRVTANGGNTAGHRVRIDHPYLNGHPEAILFATHVWNPPGQTTMYDNHPISVSYDTGSARWTVQHDDFAPMLSGTTYNLRIDPTALRITTTSNNYFGNMMRIDNATATGNRYAIILVTPVAANTVNPHPIGVGFAGNTHWYVYNLDGAAIPTGATFHVKVFGYGNYASESSLSSLTANTFGIGIDMDSYSRTLGNSRFLDWPWLNGHPAAIVLATANRDPIGRQPPIDNARYTGVWYDGNRWAVYNENQGPMPRTTAFDIWSGATQKFVPFPPVSGSWDF